jgi:hypothetical protein
MGGFAGSWRAGAPQLPSTDDFCVLSAVPVTVELPGHAALTAQAGSRQSIGAPPCSTSSSLARLNGREPKNPDRADSGEG